jgi:ribosomal protein L40E
MATKGDRGMNDNICVMCGAQLPTECGKQYCKECEEKVNEQV